jgi:hemolysin III
VSVDTPHYARHHSHLEEVANAATHALGLVAAAAGALMVVLAAARRGDAWHVLACAVYAATLVGAYAASTLSHVARTPRWRHAWRIADQAIIFLFIAGSWTPFAVAHLRGGAWWVLHAAVWAIAAFGFVSKTLFAHRVRLGTVSTGLYVLQGWLPLFAAPHMPFAPAAWLVAGGVCYTAGLGFFAYDHRIRYFHAAWHVMVIAGSACHFLGILLYCAGGVT